MVRRKIEIERIDDSSKRHTTFTKRRQGLMKKGEEFFQKYEAEGAIIAFSKAGNAYILANPNIDVVVNRYVPESSSALAAAGNDGEGSSGGGAVRVHGGEEAEAEALPLMEVQRRVGDVAEKGGWNEAVGDLGLEELDELYVQMKEFKHRVAARAREIAAAVEPEGGSSVGEGNSSRGCSS